MENFYKKWFLPLALPSILLFIFVILIPFVTGVFYSFTSWRGTYFANADNAFQAFIGFENYAKVFKNAKFMSALVFTLQYTIIATIAINIASLTLALLINSILKGAGVFRTLFFMPNLLGGLTLGFIWQFIFLEVFSKVLFGKDGVLPIEALTYMTKDHYKALFAIAMMVVWQSAGYNMIIYVGGLNNIPSDLYEAADIDGANVFQRFVHITLPMLMPAFTIVFFLTIAGSFRLLDQNVALTDGAFSTRMLALQILRTTSETSPPNFGLAQAQAVIFFIMIATVSLIQVSATKKREVEA